MKTGTNIQEKFRVLKRALQRYQTERLRRTYADLEEDPAYRRLVRFFFEHIYGPQNFELRNQSIKSLHQKLSGILKGEIIDNVGKVIELQELSEELDELMTHKMLEYGLEENFREEEYQDIYRRCNNYDRRVYQISLLVESVKGIHHISQMRLIGWSLKVVRSTAHLAGMGNIMDFLVQGYEAFHSTKNIDYFTETIRKRETARNEQLFAF